ncbi:MAG: pilus assembly protein [Anaerovibrio sp.]|uniref:TadE/TadG family type IV pilus assembly protein n=1 Tax=Anaerovibrio sp. TaxID=1872532 RepID=UPI0025FFBB3F|nr:TadE family protein [Anaerovibrio sp.]MCR5177123.1 pilus assembly protein [Anaerovibrio sp.]
MKFQRGQSIVEFAIIMPLFLLFIFGIIYTGFAFSDYLMLNHTVRSVAHEASLADTEDEYPNIIINNTQYAVLKSDLYKWEPDRTTGTNNKYLTIKHDNTRHEVIVTATATYNTSQSYIARLLNGFSSSYTADAITMEYIMYSPDKDN